MKFYIKYLKNAILNIIRVCGYKNLFVCDAFPNSKIIILSVIKCTKIRIKL